jgi:hypothetical protein
MDIAQDRKIDKMIADVGVNHHQDCPMGRNFMAFSMSTRGEQANERYRKNFDIIFPDSPGAGV